MSAATVSYLARRAARKEGVRLLYGRVLGGARNCYTHEIAGKPKVSSQWEFYSQKDEANGGVFDGRRNPFVTFVLGGPGSGKGTQCTRIAETFGFAHLSAGDLLREEISSNSEKGSLILNTIKEGGIVPSEVTIKLIKKAIEAGGNRKFLIDGFPRSEENRIAYERVMGSEPDIVLFFDCPEEVMVDRVLNRNQGRIDDNMDTVKERLKVFAEVSLPVIKHYSKKGKLYKIDGTGSEDEIFERVRPVFMHLDRSTCSP